MSGSLGVEGAAGLGVEATREPRAGVYRRRGMWRIWLALVVLAVLAAGCGAEPPTEGGESARPESTVESPSTTATITTSTLAGPEAVEGEWVTIAPSFEIDGFTTSPEDAAEIHVIRSATGTYWAAGNIGGHPTIWRSNDLVDFRVVYFDDWESQARWIRLEQIVEFDGRVLVGGAGRVSQGAGADVERSFLFVTDDNGASWSEFEDPVLSEPFQRLDRLIVAGGSLIMDVVNDECCDTPVWTPARTIDLLELQPVVLPAADADSWAYLITDEQDSLWAIEDRWDAVFRRIVWTSTDGGASWDRNETTVGGRGTAAVGGSLAFMADYRFGGYGGPAILEPRPPTRFSNGEWSSLDIDVGQWGDGNAQITGINDPDTGRFYGVLHRTIRASPHYCFDAAASCADSQLVLVTTTDGLVWRDVVSDTRAALSGDDLFITVDGGVAIFNRRDDSGNRSPLLTVWQGDSVPPTVDPPSYPPAETPVPFFDFEEGLPVGTERRYAWGLGDCGGMYIDQITWVTALEPDTSGWPIRDVEISDGPSSFAYGRVERLAADIIEFSIEQTDIAITLTPRGEDPEYSCG